MPIKSGNYIDEFTKLCVTAIKHRNTPHAGKRLCAEFHSQYDDLAFPSGYSTAFERIAAHDLEAIETAFCFFDCRPYFFRSGYMFKAFCPN